MGINAEVGEGKCFENCGAIFTDYMGVWGRSPQEKGGAEDRRKPGCSVGEGFPPLRYFTLLEVWTGYSAVLGC